MILVRHSPEVKKLVEDAINADWESGIKGQKSELVVNEEVEQFKINGYPWVGTGDESTQARRMFTKIIEKMSTIGWEFIGPVSIKGKTDALFFTFSPTEVC